MGIIEEVLKQLQEINSKLELSSNETHALKQVLNAEEIANFLKISEDKVYKLWRSRKIGYVKIGTRKVSTLKQIEKYIADNSFESVNQKGYKNNIKSI